MQSTFFDLILLSPSQPFSSLMTPTMLFIERTIAEVEMPILWPLDVKSQLIGKDSDAGKD